MLAVISPAKSLDFSSPVATTEHSTPALLPQAAELIELLRQFTPAQIASLMKLSDKLATLNVERYLEWQRPFTPDNARQAILAFNGDVYSGLDAATFSTDDFTYAQSHMRILSGLYGVLRPLDLIQAYRLEMGTKLANAKGKDLYAFWRASVTAQLNTALAEQEEKLLINLASNEYFKAVDLKQLNAAVITPVFKDYKNGQYKIISFYAKKARGMMLRFLLQHKVDNVAQLQEFDTAGYQFCAAESNETSLVFKRDKAQ